MKMRLPIALLVVALPLGARAGAKIAKHVPACSGQALAVETVGATEADAHRAFAWPVIRHPFDARRAGKDRADIGDWSVGVIARVDASGRLVCADLHSPWSRTSSRTAERQAALDALATHAFVPFQRDGHAVPVAVEFNIAEWEQPSPHRALPDVPLSQVHFHLAHSGCFGECPAYSVDVHGDGRVEFSGGGFTNVRGKHAYHIDPDAVAALVRSARDKDLWSMRAEYVADVSDLSSHRLALTFGKQTHEILDYAGAWVGMPPDVKAFQEEVDRVSRAQDFVKLSPFAVDVLAAEGFDFTSRAGASLLADAAQDSDLDDDAAMVRLVDLGAPLSGAPAPDEGFLPKREALLDAALSNQHPRLVDRLIERGALQSRGTLDRKKLDAAFVNAIRGGDVALVERIWSAGGAQHPSLTFMDVADEHAAAGTSAQVQVSVALALESRPWITRPWHGTEIAQWLVAHGVTLRGRRANGNTLLHAAAGSGDADFVAYLLSQGFDPKAPGQFDLPALGSTENEDVALLLLQAGTDVAKMDDTPGEFLRQARENHWGRVVAWMEAHPAQ